jgi:hypothetical protein
MCYCVDGARFQRLKLKKLYLLSNCAYNFKLRRYSMGHRPENNFCPGAALGVPQEVCDAVELASPDLYAQMLDDMGAFIIDKLKLA